MDPSNDDKMTAPGSTEDIVMDEEVPANESVQQPAKVSGVSTWVKLAAAFGVAGIVATSIAVPVAIKNNDESSTPYEPTPNYTTPFESKGEELPLLDDIVLDGYQSVEDFKQSLQLVAESYVNGVVARNVGDPSYEKFGMSNLMVDATMEAAMDDSATRAQPMAPTSGGSGEKVDDYDTNNQEEGVKEGDKVVSNGEIAIAAYGDEIVSWEVQEGNIVHRMTLPATGSYGKPYINTLMLQEDHLIVAVGGYGAQIQQETPRVFASYQGTRILIYNISNLKSGQMDLVTQRDVNGDFVTIRAIGTKIFFTLNSQISFFEFLGRPFEKYNTAELRDLDANSYSLQVRDMAEVSIADFVEQATQEILECNQLPQMVALNRWTTDDHSDNVMEQYLYNNGVANSMVSIVSFDLQDVIDEKPDPLQCLSVSGSFFPTNAWDVQVYSATTTAVLAIRGYDYSPSRKMSIDSTYIVAFDLTGDSVVPKSYATVEGYVLDQYSFRVEGDVLQLATTIQEGWMWFIMEPMGLRRLQAVGRPAEIIRTEPATENYVITMSLASTGQGQGQNRKMVELDRLKLGKEGEVFTTVRFYPGLAYAVTFVRMDPFYVLNTTDPTDLVIEGELDNITGWSSYLEPVNPPENSVMLAIGQEANEWGGALGLSVSVFDATDFDNVHIAARHVVEDSESAWSDSEGLRNKNAIRFNDATGKLILPLSIYGSDNGHYRGFRMYDITENSVDEVPDCEVNLSSMYSPYDYNPKSLEPRSMIIQGRFMTMMGSSIIMKDLYTCREAWRILL